MAHFHAQGLLTLALCVLISEGRADSADFEAVTATQEEDVALSCPVSNLTDPKSYRVKWIKGLDARQSKVILMRPKPSDIEDAPRVRWQANDRGQMSLFLTKLQVSDGGLYSCVICIDWDCTILRNISLRVKQCKVVPVVRVRPNNPVNLICPVNVTQGPQNILWEKLKGDNTETFLNGTSLDILSANSRDSGWYRCKFMRGKTQRCFEIKLEVGNVAAVTTSLPEPTISVVILETGHEESHGALIAVILSVTIIGIAITAAVGRLIVYKKRNNQRDLQMAWQTQRPITDPSGESTAGYEIVDFTPSNSLSFRVNSLYQDQDENMCTFHY